MHFLKLSFICILVLSSSLLFAQDVSELAKTAQAMKPGTWVELKTTVPNELWTSPPPSRGLHIAGWTDDAHWDSKTKQFFYMGMRQTRKFIAYSEKNNTWRDLGLTEDSVKSGAPHFQNKWGHIYGNNAMDTNTGKFYHMYHAGPGLTVKRQESGISVFDPSTNQWARVTDGFYMTGSIEFFSAMNAIVSISRKDGKGGNLNVFDMKKKVWVDKGRIEVHGHHSMARHNPFKKEVLLAGGNGSSRVVMRLKVDGTIEKLKDAPFDITVRGEKITIDPLSGNYLIMTSDSLFYEFNSDTNEYKLIDDFKNSKPPFSKYKMPVVAFIPEYGITFWADKKVMLYKHKSN